MNSIYWIFSQPCSTFMKIFGTSLQNKGEYRVCFLFGYSQYLRLGHHDWKESQNSERFDACEQRLEMRLEFLRMSSWPRSRTLSLQSFYFLLSVCPRRHYLSEVLIRRFHNLKSSLLLSFAPFQHSPLTIWVEVIVVRRALINLIWPIISSDTFLLLL